jgi:hypothetical protein
MNRRRNPQGEWEPRMPRTRAHDIVLHSRARRIGEGIDLRSGIMGARYELQDEEPTTEELTVPGQAN